MRLVWTGLLQPCRCARGDGRVGGGVGRFPTRREVGHRKGRHQRSQRESSLSCAPLPNRRGMLTRSTLQLGAKILCKIRVEEEEKKKKEESA